MTFNCDLFRELHTSIIFKVQIGNRDYIVVKGKCTVAIRCPSSTKLINDMLFVPNINKILLNVGFKVFFETDHCQIKNVESKDVFKVMMKGKSFTLDSLEQKQNPYVATKINAKVWHKRLGHFNHVAVINLQKNNLVQRLPYLEANIPNCNTCQFGKLGSLPFKKATWRATKKLKLIHIDLAGPKKMSLKENKYYMYKSKVVGLFWKFKQWVKTQSGYKI
ncbi:Retrovirus-related Pol polyprotein from transposon TNT 1-94 [Gossypium australe]|uniref:Retrovirus-related Pol polyprotein from transposon TNT 1-94 n=1 Tax=Gossypium australe TaxID=47621 RepID=A0A5B6UC39_9ROSI|nr:Retrovirus-related Pol polyprotein from transposon TNT 1-94 [Gossypium australe]